MKEREKEMEADDRDRQREKEEIEELRRKLTEEGHSDVEGEVARVSGQSAMVALCLEYISHDEYFVDPVEYCYVYCCYSMIIFHHSCVHLTQSNND